MFSISVAKQLETLSVEDIVEDRLRAAETALDAQDKLVSDAIPSTSRTQPSCKLPTPSSPAKLTLPSSSRVSSAKGSAGSNKSAPGQSNGKSSYVAAAAGMREMALNPFRILILHISQ